MTSSLATLPVIKEVRPLHPIQPFQTKIVPSAALLALDKSVTSIDSIANSDMNSPHRGAFLNADNSSI